MIKKVIVKDNVLLDRIQKSDIEILRKTAIRDANLNKLKEKLTKMSDRELQEEIAVGVSTVANQSLVDQTYRLSSKRTAYEVTRIAATVDNNTPLDHTTGRFDEAILSGAINVYNLAGGAAIVYVSLNARADAVNAVALTAANPTLEWDDLPVREIYAITDAGTATVQIIGTR